MKIFGRNSKFELEVAGYEFKNANEYYDANWLKIKITAEDEVNSWSATDNCLLTYELENLSEWFRDLLKADEDQYEIEFMENELKFKFDSNNDRLSIILDFNLHPKGEMFEYGDDGDEPYELEFTLNNKSIEGIIKNISDEIVRYPVRGSLD